MAGTGLRPEEEGRRWWRGGRVESLGGRMIGEKVAGKVDIEVMGEESKRNKSRWRYDN